MGFENNYEYVRTIIPYNFGSRTGECWDINNENRIDVTQLNFVTNEPANPQIGDTYLSTTGGESCVTHQAIDSDYLYTWDGSTWIKSEIGNVQILLASEIKDHFVDKNFTVACANSKAVISFENELSAEEKNQLDTIVYNHQHNL